MSDASRTSAPGDDGVAGDAHRRSDMSFGSARSKLMDGPAVALARRFHRSRGRPPAEQVAQQRELGPDMLIELRGERS
jgi:hypothetical protein